MVDKMPIWTAGGKGGPKKPEVMNEARRRRQGDRSDEKWWSEGRCWKPDTEARSGDKWFEDVRARRQRSEVEVRSQMVTRRRW